jgi:hypothetical protein
VPEVHASESNLGISADVPDPPGIVHARLRGKGEDVNALVPESFTVRRDHCHFGRKDDIEKAGCRQEVVEMGWVLLVPEDRRNALLPERVDHLDQCWPRGGLAHEMVGPGSVVSCPSTFDKEEVKTSREFLTPCLWRYERLVPLRFKGFGGELVENGGDSQVRQSWTLTARQHIRQIGSRKGDSSRRAGFASIDVCDLAVHISY